MLNERVKLSCSFKLKIKIKISRKIVIKLVQNCACGIGWFRIVMGFSRPIGQIRWIKSIKMLKFKSKIKKTKIRVSIKELNVTN